MSLWNDSSCELPITQTTGEKLPFCEISPSFSKDLIIPIFGLTPAQIKPKDLIIDIEIGVLHPFVFSPINQNVPDSGDWLSTHNSKISTIYNAESGPRDQRCVPKTSPNE